MNNNRLDVIGIGNAMVDAFIPSTKEEVKKSIKSGFNESH